MPTSLEQKTIAELERLLALEPYYSRTTPASAPRRGLPTWCAFTLGLAIATGVTYGFMKCTEPQQAAPSLPNFEFTQITKSKYDIPITANSHLSSHRTTITGVADPNSLTAAYYLAMFISNNGAAQEEALMKIRLPKGAAVTRATLWVNGVAQEAAFTSQANAENAYNWVTVQHRDPLLIEQIDPETILVKASPVMPGTRGLKLRIGITAPLTRTNLGEITGQVPTIIEKNFADGKMDVHLQTPSNIIRSHLSSVVQGGTFVVAKNARPHEYAVRATHATDGGYIVVTPENDKLTFERTLEMPAGIPIIRDNSVATRVSTMWAHEEIERLAKENRTGEAVEYASAYRVISSVSGAVVLERQSDYEQQGLNRDMNKRVSFSTSTESNAPILQGATNGTIGPQSSDATVITGVNTAGTVRVMNLANAEEALNAVASAGGPGAQAGVNWLVGSARDANLFSGDDLWAGGALGLIPMLCAIAFFPLIALNIAPALVCGVRCLSHTFGGKPGAARLLGLTIVFSLLAAFLPVLNQLLSAAMAVVLARRWMLKRQNTRRNRLNEMFSATSSSPTYL